MKSRRNRGWRGTGLFKFNEFGAFSALFNDKKGDWFLFKLGWKTMDYWYKFRGGKEEGIYKGGWEGKRRGIAGEEFWL